MLPDEAVDPSITVEFEGRTIGFCCQRCRKDFLEDPEAYRAALPPPSDGTAASLPHDHDHASDHGDGVSGGERGIRFAGKFHPVLVHFPIALLLAAAGLELWSWLGRRERLERLVRFATVAGGVGAVAAAPLGWAAASGSRYPATLANALLVHRWLGTAGAALAVVAAALALRAWKRGDPTGWAFRSALLVSAALIGVAGHFGATLVYGPDHFAW